MADEIELVVGGRVWSRWREANVTLRLGSASGDYSLTLDDRWGGTLDELDFSPDASASVRVAGETVITGPIDRVAPRYDDKGYTVTVEGRDLPAQMADCAAMNKPGEWAGVGLDVIARELAQPFGVGVSASADLGGPFVKFTLDEGERAWDALRRACLHRAVLLATDGLGNLALTTAGAGGHIPDIVLGPDNVLRGEGTFDHTDRFSAYHVRGQDQANVFGTASTHATVEGVASDPGVRLHRPTIELARIAGGVDALTRHAEALAAIAAGKARKLRYGLFWPRTGGDGAGSLWRPNRTIPVADPWLRVDQTMLIEEAKFSVASDRLRVDLGLVHPDAWRLIALPEKEQDGVGW